MCVCVCVCVCALWVVLQPGIVGGVTTWHCGWCYNLELWVVLQLGIVGGVTTWHCGCVLQLCEDVGINASGQRVCQGMEFTALDCVRLAYALTEQALDQVMPVTQ